MVYLTEPDLSTEYLVQENERLRARIKELDSFAQTVAHDLKHPIATIHGFASLIQDYQERLSKEEMTTTAGFILEQSHRLAEMIDSILLFSRISSTDEIRLEPLNMHEIVEYAQITLMNMISQSGAHIRIPEVWPVALGHGRWVEHVWLNYISNAIKYGGNPPLIELGAKPVYKGQVVFWVRDNGAGLTPEQQAAVFKPFIRFKKHTAEGHGLGLAIVARIIKKLGGTVGVESIIGKGSTFSFSLPAA